MKRRPIGKRALSKIVNIRYGEAPSNMIHDATRMKVDRTVDTMVHLQSTMKRIRAEYEPIAKEPKINYNFFDMF